MTIVYYLALILHLAACFFLIAVVLLQQGKGGDLAGAFGGGGTQTAFGPRGSANVLSRATTILAAVFMATSLVLSTVRPASRGGVLDQMAAPAPAASPAAAAPAASPAAAPAQPAAPASSPAAK